MASMWDIPSSSHQSLVEHIDPKLACSSLKLLTPLDELLRCHICFEYFNDCMMTKCSHNFCSLCIRRYMMCKSQCPTCFQVTSEPELKNNRLIDEILVLYKPLRETIENSMQYYNTEGSLTTTADTTIQSNESLSPKERVIDSIQNVKILHDLENPTQEFNEVPCPVCTAPVQTEKINVHLDNCLADKEEIDPSQRNEKKLLPKLVYHLLSDQEIRKKVEEHGLSTSGDRQVLIRRHKKFLVLHNANCDSLNPRPVSELLKQIEGQENEESAYITKKILQFHKKSEPSVIEREQESYLRQHQDEFDALIEDVRTRQQKQKTTLKQNLKTKEQQSLTGQSPLHFNDSPGEVDDRSKKQIDPVHKSCD